MQARIAIALFLAAAALAATLALLRPPGQTATSEPQQPDTTLSSVAPKPLRPPPPETPEPLAAPRPLAPPETKTAVVSAAVGPSAATTNKLERLTQIRESFRRLAA